MKTNSRLLIILEELTLLADNGEEVVEEGVKLSPLISTTFSPTFIVRRRKIIFHSLMCNEARPYAGPSLSYKTQSTFFLIYWYSFPPSLHEGTTEVSARLTLISPMPSQVVLLGENRKCDFHSVRYSTTRRLPSRGVYRLYGQISFYSVFQSQEVVSLSLRVNSTHNFKGQIYIHNFDLVPMSCAIYRNFRQA